MHGLKSIQTYLARAREVGRRDPIASYFCRLYAAHLALEQGSTDAVPGLIGELETEKKELASRPEGAQVLRDDREAYRYMEGLASRVLEAADAKEKQSGSIETARAFLAAATFFSVLKLFTAELEPEVEARIRYSKWRASTAAAQIRSEPEPDLGRLEAIREAQRHCKLAINALDYEDVGTAQERLKSALGLLDSA